MTLQSVELTVDVFSTCLQHALATEKEEIMGLLIGEVNKDTMTVKIVSSMKLRRSDKTKDRVEISEEQLVEATFYAEELTHKFSKDLKVVGWYHSHPHITVWPSHVDLRTQSMYQNMEPTFVGLIFAVYMTDQGSKTNDVQLTCFQSTCSLERKEIPFSIIPSDNEHVKDYLEALVKLPNTFNEEERESFSKSTRGDEHELLTDEHNNAVLTLSLSHITNRITRPMVEVFYETNKHRKSRLEALRSYHKFLKKALENTTKD